MNSSTAIPSQKITASALGGAIVTILLWLLTAYVPHFNPPPEVVAALVVVVSFAVGYAVPPAERDAVVPKDQT